MGRYVEYDPDELYNSTNRKTVEKWLDEAEESMDEDRFTDWEREFLESVRKQFDRTPGETPLSGKQLAILRRLYDKAGE